MKKAILNVCQIICHMNKSKMGSNRDKQCLVDSVYFKMS